MNRTHFRHASLPYVLLIGLVSLCACSSSKGAEGGSGGAETAEGVPPWFEKPPKEGAMVLFFVGDASDAPDEGMARDLSLQKALFNLTIFVGADIKSDFKSVEQERNGQTDQMVSVVVDIAGENMEIAGVRVAKHAIVPKDGRFDGYTMIEWPKVELQKVITARKNRAERALALFLEAQENTKQRKLGDAEAQVKEAASLLGISKTPVALSHPQYKDSAVLSTALEALTAEIAVVGKERKGVCAVAVRCLEDGHAADCGGRAGVLQQAVAESGKKISSAPIDEKVVAEILSAKSKGSNVEVRNAGCVIAAQYSSTTMDDDGGGNLFIRWEARTVIYDPESGRIVDSLELPPTKEGFPILDGAKKRAFSGATKKGFDLAQKSIQQWIKTALKKQ